MPDCPENGNVILILVACVLVGSSAIQSATGSGFGLVAGPALILIAPQLVPAPLLLLTLPIMGLVAIRERRHCDLKAVLIASATMIPGIAAGLWFLGRVEVTVVHVLVAVVALAAGAALLTGKSFGGTSHALAGAGIAAGFMGALAAMPGPPLSLTYRTPNAAELRSTLSTIFLLMAAATLAALQFQVGITRVELLTALALSPLLLCGHALGTLVARRISLLTSNRVTTYVIIVAATALLLRSVTVAT